MKWHDFGLNQSTCWIRTDFDLPRLWCRCELTELTERDNSDESKFAKCVKTVSFIFWFAKLFCIHSSHSVRCTSIPYYYYWNAWMDSEWLMDTYEYAEEKLRAQHLSHFIIKRRRKKNNKFSPRPFALKCSSVKSNSNILTVCNSVWLIISIRLQFTSRSCI